MFKENATNLNNISVDKGIEWLQSFDTILSDCDGKYIYFDGDGKIHTKNTVCTFVITS